MLNLINGDCIEEMKKLPENSVDAIITDPPYDLTSMNTPGPDKQGGSSLQFCRIQASKGFMGKTWDGTGIAFKPETWKEAMRVLKPGGYLLSFGGTRTYHRMACAIEDAGFEIRDMIEWIYGSGFPKSLNVANAIAKREGAKREGAGSLGNTFPLTSEYRDYVLTENAKQHEGWGTALKPAHEPIVVARKPLSEKTVAENVLKFGTGGINIDESRIEHNEKQKETVRNNSNSLYEGGWQQEKNVLASPSPLGRFPANLIHDGSDEVLLGFPDVEEEDLNNSVVQQTLLGDKIEKKIINSSRFFYCAKAGKEERNYGCEELPLKLGGGLNATVMGVSRTGQKVYNNNNHPTVKPISLMEYLIKLITPTNGVVLDCFMGSGTTGIAAVKLGFNFIGIEKEKEYIEIARARINAYAEQQKLNSFESQTNGGDTNETESIRVFE
jgi:site-specific DNA-methyltransferase (adenine-specific)